jgi:anti-sigma regulatory factor (Ser/Thr protein kinase)
MKFENQKNAFIIKFSENEIKEINKNKQIILNYPNTEKMAIATSEAMLNIVEILREVIGKKD